MASVKEDFANLSRRNDAETTEIFRNEPAREESVEPGFKPWRVFINHVDSYHGRKLADVSIKLLSDARFYRTFHFATDFK